jgi:hypothetical protein
VCAMREERQARRVRVHACGFGERGLLVRRRCRGRESAGLQLRLRDDIPPSQPGTVGVCCTGIPAHYCGCEWAACNGACPEHVFIFVAAALRRRLHAPPPRPRDSRCTGVCLWTLPASPRDNISRCRSGRFGGIFGRWIQPPAATTPSQRSVLAIGRATTAPTLFLPQRQLQPVWADATTGGSCPSQLGICQ